MMHDRDERTLYARQRDRIAALEAELEAARADAQRGRWIIARMHRDHNGIDGPSRWFFAIYDRDEGYPKSSPYYKGEPFANVTAAIDAAMKD